MQGSDRVRSSTEGKHKLKQAYKAADLTQEGLAAKANISVDMLKRLLGTKSCENGVDRHAVENIARVVNLEPTDIVDSTEWFSQQPLPPEFAPLIQDKTSIFCGRQFVFEAFRQFTREHSCGYFLAIGDAGMGKTAFAAQYVKKYRVPCYFNILAEQRNRPELFFKSIRQQLIARYGLEGEKEADLSTLLTKVAQKLKPTERLVIVVDALDEVEQEPGGNLLHLPMTLPDRVYFLLTRRPYSLPKKRLLVSPGIPVVELDLQAEKYAVLSRQDVEDYIRFSLQEENEDREALNRWIVERKITLAEFVEQVAQKSESNFMYLRYVLPGIARGFYDDLSLKQLPDGLQEYYQSHWGRMKMDSQQQEIKVIILFILVEIATPITCEMVAEIADREDVEDVDVERILEEWVEYLRPQEIEGEECYGIYHASFLDFLKKKRDLKKTRKLFKAVNLRISDYLYQSTRGD